MPVLSPRARIVIGTLLIVVMAAAFTGFAATNTVRSNLARESFYRGALDENNAYDRLYDDLSEDQAFSEQLANLLGGVDVESGDVVATLKEVVDPDDLRAAVEDAIERVVAYIRSEGDLDLSLDITPFIRGIYNVALGYAVDAIVALPENETDTYEEFEAELVNLLDLLSGEGRIPEGIPSYPLPPERQQEVALIIIEAAALDLSEPADLEVGNAIAQAILDDDVDLAIRVATASLLDKLIQTSILALTENEFVYRVENGDDVRFMLEPPASVTDKLQGRLRIARQVNGSAGWARPVLLLVALLSAVGMGVVFQPRRRDSLRWIGAGLIASGMLAFLGWLVARGMARDRVVDAVIRKASILPPSFQEIVRDVVDGASWDLTPAIWWPAIGITLVGAVIVGVSFVIPERLPGAEAGPLPPSI